MSEARTKLDILYQEVLGDVHAILNHVDELKAGLPTAFDGAASKLQGQTESMLAAAQQHRQGLNDLIKKVDAHIEAAARNAAELAKFDIRKSAATEIENYASTALQPILKKVTDDTAEAIGKLNDSVNQFNAARGLIVFYCFLGSILGVGILDLIIFWLYKVLAKK